MSIRLLGLVGCVRAKKSSCSCWFKKFEGSDHWENLHINGSILLDWFFEKRMGIGWINLVQDRVM